MAGEDPASRQLLIRQLVNQGLALDEAGRVRLTERGFDVHSAIAALESYRQTVPLQEQVVVEDGIASLQRGEHDKIAALEKQIEELAAKWRKLQERVDAIPET